MNGVHIKENHFATSLKWHCEVLRMSRLSCFPITVYFKKIFSFDGFPDSTRPMEAEMNFNDSRSEVQTW